MPGNAAATLGGPAGLRLKAWAIVTGPGALLQHLGFTSFNRGSAGSYTAVLSAALSDYTKAYVRLRLNTASGGQWFAFGRASAATAIAAFVTNAAVATDPESFHVEVWEP